MISVPPRRASQQDHRLVDTNDQSLTVELQVIKVPLGEWEKKSIGKKI